MPSCTYLSNVLVALVLSGLTCSADPVNGSWTEWSTCSADCFGTQVRTCSNPPPYDGGANCTGPSEQACNTDRTSCAGYSAQLSFWHYNDTCSGESTGDDLVRTNSCEEGENGVVAGLFYRLQCATESLSSTWTMSVGSVCGNWAYVFNGSGSTCYFGDGYSFEIDCTDHPEGSPGIETTIIPLAVTGALVVFVGVTATLLYYFYFKPKFKKEAELREQLGPGYAQLDDLTHSESRGSINDPRFRGEHTITINPRSNTPYQKPKNPPTS